MEHTEEQVKKVVSEICETSEYSHLKENPINFLHVLIAYLRCPEDNNPTDFAINAVIALFIRSLLPKIKEDSINITIKEIDIICRSFFSAGDIFDKNETK
ncbi:MAG TPA: hypothetical protein VHZ76_04065 [Gammaproteobacteria bacterium]|jgi:hypothetical protein|nr:hypothetical protein [Gammaproteobacteria bacterium]